MVQDPATDNPLKILHLSLFMGEISRFTGAGDDWGRYRSSILYCTLFIKVGF